MSVYVPSDLPALYRLLRNPLLGIGLALVALGTGNWINGRMKIDEYATIAARETAEPQVESYEGFPHLTQRTNANLLRPLTSPSSMYSYAAGKVEFYRVVVTGGQLLVTLGSLLLIVGALREHRQRSQQQGLVGAPGPT